MSAKLLLVLGIILGILVAGFVLLQQRAVEPEPAAEGRLVGRGHFVLERSGVRLLEETYLLVFVPDDGVELTSQGTLSAAGIRIGIAQETHYDGEYNPIAYELTATLPTGTQVISAHRGEGVFRMDVRSGAARQAVDGALEDSLVLLDNNVIAHYAVLIEALAAGAVSQTFSAAVPQALAEVPSRWEEPVPARFRSGDRTYDGNRIAVHLGDTAIDLVTYEGRLAGLVNRRQGTVGYDVELLPDGFALEESAPESAPVGLAERVISFRSADITLAGTLTLPGSQTAPQCAVLFVAGSGPVDRDGNAPGLQMDAYRQLARSLAQEGVASLRYDKRGVGESEGDSATASRADLLDDVRAAWEALGAQPEVARLPRIALGHSEGTYLVEDLAAGNADVGGLILLCGSPQSLAGVTRWQVESLLRQQGATEDQVLAALEQEDQFIAFVKASTGQWSDITVAALREALPWVTDAAAEQLKGSALGLAWLREHYRADPALVLAGVTCPVLIVSAGKDTQVPPADGQALAQVLKTAGNNDVTSILLPDLNHVLRHHPEEPNLVYQHLDEPVDPRVPAAIADWVSRGFSD